MTADSNEHGYLLTREGVILIAMVMDGDVAMRARVEIANIVAAWWRGQIVSRREAPTLADLLDDGPGSGWHEIDAPEPSAPIEIAGGVTGLQKHLVALADKNRGLDPAVLKTLFDEHQVVIAVWPSPELAWRGFPYIEVPC